MLFAQAEEVTVDLDLSVGKPGAPEDQFDLPEVTPVDVGGLDKVALVSYHVDAAWKNHEKFGREFVSFLHLVHAILEAWEDQGSEFDHKLCRAVGEEVELPDCALVHAAGEFEFHLVA